MKILSITNDIDSGGAAKSLFVLARNLAALGQAVHVVGFSQSGRTSGRMEELAALGVGTDLIRVPYYPLSLVGCPIPFWKNVARSLRRAGEYLRLRRLVKALDPDVVHYNSYTTLLTALPLRGRPGVLHAREVLLEDSRLLRATRALVRARIREVVAISPVEAEQVSRVFGLRATTVFNSPLEPPRLEPMPQSNGPVFAMFSHVSPAKGHRLCIRACARVADKLRAAGVRVRLYGGRIGIHADLYASLEQEIEDLGLGDMVSFQGFAAAPEQEMRGIHLLLRPDLSGHPWGRDVIEAMSLGRPVLAAGESRTFIRPGENGMLVPAGDEEAFSRALVELADCDLLERMGRRAYEFAAQHFDPQATARQVLACLERAAGSVQA